MQTTILMLALASSLTLTMAKVAKTVYPESMPGQCWTLGKQHGCSIEKHHDTIELLIECKISHCTKDGDACTVAYVSDKEQDGKNGFMSGRMAKCPVNDVPYE